jgi:16S rRNA (guanine1516-N2)-methyltransferase
MTMRPAVSAVKPEQNERAAQMAADLDLPLVAVNDADHPLQLRVGPEGLSLHLAGQGGDVRVDWTGGRVGYRRRAASIRGEYLARAVGLKPGVRPTVIDTCAGLGQDGFLLATLGCRVTLLERSPMLFALLHDGLQRSMHDPQLRNWLAERLRLIRADARHHLDRLNDGQRPDVVYLDPMYPARDKSALVKKEMRVLRAVVGDDDDAAELLDVALYAARRRVVVKRPRRAPAIEGPAPSWTLPGRSSRFDVYQTRD